MHRNSSPADRQAADQQSMLSAALDYHQRGWSLIPMRMAAKRPACRWKRRQTVPAKGADLRKWFADGKPYGIGVIFGAVSGDLAERDFDDLADYERWVGDRPELAAVLPTIETRRGRRVLFTAAPGSIAAYRKSIGKPNGTGHIPCGKGELRAGIGCYSVLPPSVHPSGHVYRWLVPLPDGPLPVIDPVEGGLVQVTEWYLSDGEGCGGELPPSEFNPADNQSPQRITIHQSLQFPLDPLLHARVALAIQRTLPTHNGKRRTCLLKFARELKSMPEFADMPAEALKPILREWHQRALLSITTLAFEETRIDFLNAWEDVKYPVGQGPLDQLFIRAQAAHVPAVALDYENPKLRLLVALLRELQRASPGQPIFLAQRDGGRLLGVSHVQVSRWLKLLRRDHVLHRVSPASFENGRADRYRFLADLD